MIKFNSIFAQPNYLKPAEKQEITSQNTSTQKVSNPINLVDLTHNNLLVKKKSNLSFNGTKNLTSLEVNLMKVLEAAKKASELNDEASLIFINKTPDFIKDAAQEAKSLFYKVIDKIYFIKDESIEHPISLSVEGGFQTVFNHSNAPVYVNDIELAKNEFQSIFTNNAAENVIEINSHKIRLFDSTKLTPDDYPNEMTTSVKWIDLKSQNDETVSKLNEDYLAIAAKGFKPESPVIEVGHVPHPGAKAPKTKQLKSTAKNTSNNIIGAGARLSDVGGLKEPIKLLKKNILNPIRYPEAFKKINHGVLLDGPAGTGKSLLAEAVANESGAHLIKLNASELESKWVGETEENLRELFHEATQKQPCVIFIDEIDAIGKQRAGSEASRHDDKTLNTILGCMSDIEKSKAQVYIIGTTNFKGSLDNALTRSGRFGLHIDVPLPDAEGCKEIFDIHIKGNPIEMASNIDIDKFIAKLPQKQCSGADIDEIVRRSIDNAYERGGIDTKMDNGTFELNDLDNLFIEKDDLEKAFEEVTKDRKMARRLGL